MFQGILHHTLYLITFRHDGRGLPTKFGPILHTCLLLGLIVFVARDQLLENPNPLQAGVAALIGYALVGILFRKMATVALSGYALLSASEYLTDIALQLAAPALRTQLHLEMVLEVWAILALTALLHRNHRRIHDTEREDAAPQALLACPRCNCYPAMNSRSHEEAVKRYALQCQCGFTGDEGSTIQEARTAWNQRVRDTPAKAS